MSKVTLITGIVVYLFGFAGHLIVFAASNWAGLDWFLANALEGGGRAAIWPYLIYEWIRFDTPLV